MANYKRKRKYARSSSKCGICCGQRRHFGALTKVKGARKRAARELQESLC